MKTAELIDLLAREAGPAPRGLVARRLATAVLPGLAASIAAALLIQGPVPPALFAEPGMWVKLLYAATLGAAGAWLSARFARPVPRAAAAARLWLTVVAVMLLFGLVSLLLTPAGGRLAALLGHSWARCPWSVLALSLPALAGGLWALRGLAPTRPRAAGLAVGLLAGALGAFGYAFSCSELAPAFVAVWYSLGVALVGGLGALLGPRVLRW